MIKYELKIKERGKDSILTPSHYTSENEDPGLDYIKKFFGVEDPDVEWYKIRRITTDEGNITDSYTTFLTTREGKDIYLTLTGTDAKASYHSGNCDDDVEQTMKFQYVKDQLKEISDADLESTLTECGCEFNEKDRHKMEGLFVWLAAGNITEEIAEFEKLR